MKSIILSLIAGFCLSGEWVSAQTCPSVANPVLTQISYDNALYVDYSGFDSNTAATNYIAVFSRGAANSRPITYAYLGASCGRLRLPVPMFPGEYEVRGFLNNGNLDVVTGYFTISEFGRFSNVSAFQACPTSSPGFGNVSIFPSEIHMDFEGMNSSSIDQSWVGIYNSSGTLLTYSYLKESCGRTVLRYPLSGGAYEVRAHLYGIPNLTATKTFSYVPSAAGNPTIDAVELSADKVRVTYSGFPFASNNWIAVAHKDMTNVSFLKYAYINPQGSGTIDLPIVLAPGEFEVRGYLRDSATISVSRAFVKAGDVASPNPSFQILQSNETGVRFAFMGFPYSTKNWVSLSRVGTGPGEYLSWQYLPASADGEGLFAVALQPGDYEVRAFLNNSYQISTSAQFTVDAPLLMSAQSAEVVSSIPDVEAPAVVVVPPGLQLLESSASVVRVAYSSFPLGTHNWISISAKGAGAGEYLAWKYLPLLTAAELSLDVSFVPGDYEVRGFLNNGHEIVALAPFTIVPPPVVVPDEGTSGGGEEVVEGDEEVIVDEPVDNSNDVDVIEPVVVAPTGVRVERIKLRIEQIRQKMEKSRLKFEARLAQMEANFQKRQNELMRKIAEATSSAGKKNSKNANAKKENALEAQLEKLKLDHARKQKRLQDKQAKAKTHWDQRILKLETKISLLKP